MPKPHKPGIYFDLPEDEYHADPSFSSSGIKNLMISPETYWTHSHRNPARDTRPANSAMAIGKALHTLLLEGADNFHKSYARELDPADYPMALDKSDELRAACRDLGLKVSGSKAELVARLKEAQEARPGMVFWSDLLAEHGRAQAGKTLLSGELYDRIEHAAAIFARNPGIKDLFSDGYPEVSVFWRDDSTDVAMKARLDWLRSDRVVDLKTFSNPAGKPVNTAITHAIANYRYHVQAAVYMDAAENAKRLPINKGRIPKAWEKRFRGRREHDFWFVFFQPFDAPTLRVRSFHNEIAGRDTLYWVSGHNEYLVALQRYAEFERHFGDSPWVLLEEVRPLVDEEFPLWMMA